MQAKIWSMTSYVGGNATDVDTERESRRVPRDGSHPFRDLDDDVYQYDHLAFDAEPRCAGEFPGSAIGLTLEVPGEGYLFRSGQCEALPAWPETHTSKDVLVASFLASISVGGQEHITQLPVGIGGLPPGFSGTISSSLIALESDKLKVTFTGSVRGPLGDTHSVTYTDWIWLEPSFDLRNVGRLFNARSSLEPSYSLDGLENRVVSSFLTFMRQFFEGPTSVTGPIEQLITAEVERQARKALLPSVTAPSDATVSVQSVTINAGGISCRASIGWFDRVDTFYRLLHNYLLVNGSAHFGECRYGAPIEKEVVLRAKGPDGVLISEIEIEPPGSDLISMKPLVVTIAGDRETEALMVGPVRLDSAHYLKLKLELKRDATGPDGGPIHGTIRIGNDSFNHRPSLSITFDGEVLPARRWIDVPELVDFGAFCASFDTLEETFTIFNSGELELTVTSVRMASGDRPAIRQDGFSIVDGPSTPFSLLPRERKHVKVRFVGGRRRRLPGTESGRGDYVIVESNAENAPTARIRLYVGPRTHVTQPEFEVEFEIELERIRKRLTEGLRQVFDAQIAATIEGEIDRIRSLMARSVVPPADDPRAAIEPRASVLIQAPPR